MEYSHQSKYSWKTKAGWCNKCNGWVTIWCIMRNYWWMDSWKETTYKQCQIKTITDCNGSGTYGYANANWRAKLIKDNETIEIMMDVVNGNSQWKSMQILKKKKGGICMWWWWGGMLKEQIIDDGMANATNDPQQSKYKDSNGYSDQHNSMDK